MPSQRQPAKRYSNLRTEILCGRKVWTYRCCSGLPEIWVHSSPYTKPLVYLRGSSLTEGTPEADIDYLESLIAENIARLRPISRTQELMWDKEHAEERAYI